MPIWFNGGQDEGTFSIGEEYSQNAMLTGRYEYDTTTWQFTWYFNAEPESPMFIYPQFAFNWGDDEPESEWKGSDFQGFYLWISAEPVW